MSYTHLTEQDRACIYHNKSPNLSDAEVGRRIGRHRATIGRELKRFRRHPSWPCYKTYFPDGAHWLARKNRCKPRGIRWTRHRPLLAYVLRGLRQEWSPEQIAGRLKRDFPRDKRMRVSHQSIYSYIQADRKADGALWKRLRQSSRIRRKAYGSGARRQRIPDRVGIDQRPAEVESRKQVGHWEGDTMLGQGKARLATCVERKSRYVFIARLPDGTACQFNAAAIKRLRKIPPGGRKTMTTDNGSEFVEHKTLGKRLGFKTFFADPFASWQRGTNENTNGLIRQYFPKGTDFSTVSVQKVARVATKLNNRPRKCLRYKTPAEVLGPVLRF
jgi:IS30 family transposase